MYTSELSDYLGSFFVPILLIVFISAVIRGYCFGPIAKKPSWLQELQEGRFNMGYIEDDPVATEFVKMEILTEEMPTKKHTKELPTKELPTKQHTEEFIEECTASLANLGIKRAAAKRNTTTFLDKNPDIQTVEEFIIGIMKK